MIFLSGQTPSTNFPRVNALQNGYGDGKIDFAVWRGVYYVRGAANYQHSETAGDQPVASAFVR